MFCLRCGKQIDDNSMSCPYCGCATENAGEINSNTMFPEDNINKKNADGLATAGLVVGAIGIVLAWLIALLGYIFGVLSLTLSIIAVKKTKDNKKAKIGLVLSIITFVCSLISSIIGIILLM